MWRALSTILLLIFLIVGLLLLLALETSFFAWPQSNPGLASFTKSIAQTFISAGIIGLIYDLIAKTLSEKEQSEKLLEWTISTLDATDKKIEAKLDKLEDRIPSITISSMRSIQALREDEQWATLSNLITTICESDKLSIAFFKLIEGSIKNDTYVWKDTKHIFNLYEIEGIDFVYKLIDKVSYYGHIDCSFLTFGFFDSFKSYEQIKDKIDLDGFWVNPKGFEAEEIHKSNILDIDNLIIKEGNKEFPHKKIISNKEEGVRIITFNFEQNIKSKHVYYSYTITALTDATLPFAQVILPFVSEGLTVDITSHIASKSRLVEKIFLGPNISYSVETISAGRKLIQTDEVLLHGNGVLVIAKSN